MLALNHSDSSDSVIEDLPSQFLPSPQGSLLIVANDPKLYPLKNAVREANLVAHCYNPPVPDSAVLTSATPTKLKEYLHQHGFRRLHWIGHANAGVHGSQKKTLACTDENGVMHVVDPEVLASLFGHAQLELAVLMGCESMLIGKHMIQAGVEYVVCWKTILLDFAAPVFSEALHRALDRGYQIREAFEQATDSLHLQTGKTKRGRKSSGVCGSDFKAEKPDRNKNGVTRDGESWAVGIPVLLWRMPRKLYAGVPPIGIHFFERPSTSAALLNHLISDGDECAASTVRQPCSLIGPGGIGKSTIIAATARSVEIQSAFHHGIAFLEVGQHMESAMLIDLLLRQLRKVLGHPTESTAVGENSLDQIAQLISGKKCLIVLDDVWSKEQLSSVVSAVASASGGSQILLSSRDAALTRNIGATVVAVETWNEATAVELLAKWSGHTGGTAFTQTAKRVAHLCSFLPLALAAAGAIAQDSDWSEVEALLLEHDLESLQCTGQRTGSIYGVLSVSMNSLETVQQELYSNLVLLPVSDRIPMGVVAMLSDMSISKAQRICRSLHNKSLLVLSVDAECVSVQTHNLHWSFLLKQPNKPRFDTFIALVRKLASSSSTCISEMLSFLDDANPGVRYAAHRWLQRQAWQMDQNQSARLVQALRTEATSPAAAIRTVAVFAQYCDENRISINASDGPRALVSLAEDGSREVRENAIAALGNLAAGSAENKDAVGDAGGVHALIKLARETSASSLAAQEMALERVDSQGRVSTAGKDVIREAGGINVLIQIARKGSLAAKIHAAAVLGNLGSQNNENKEAIGRGKGLEALVCVVNTVVESAHAAQVHTHS